jgi:hypothetical protein
MKIGNFVRLNSGGPTMMVVEIDGNAVTVAWRSKEKVWERLFPLVCVHRACPANAESAWPNA